MSEEDEAVAQMARAVLQSCPKLGSMESAHRVVAAAMRAMPDDYLVLELKKRGLIQNMKMPAADV